MNELSAYKTYKPILLIEDNLGDARLVEILLEEFEISTHHVTSLAEGFAALKDTDFSAILLDIHLPDSRGLETVERLLAQFPDANVIVLTGLPDKSYGLKAVKSGAQDYLLKGEFSAEELAKTLRYSIERNRIKKRLEEAQRIANMGHWEYDPSQRKISVSDEIFRIFGIDNNDSDLISYEKALTYIHPEDIPIVDDLKNKLKSENETVETELRIKNSTDDLRYIMVLCQPHRDRNNRIVQVTGVVQDITEKKLAQELIKEKEVQEKAAQLKEGLLANVSHEMRTPLNAVQGFSELLLKSNLNEEQLADVKTIHRSSKYLLGIISDILQISNLQFNEIKFSEDCFQLSTFMAKVFNIIKYQANEKGLEAKLTMETDASTIIKGDQLRLEQVLLNLATNAIKFTDEGKIHIHVGLVKKEGDLLTLKFDVTDTGIGIESDKQDAIFETFTRVAPKERVFDGIGLGLPIVKYIVERQNGKVYVNSTLGLGSTFSFELMFKEGTKEEIESDLLNEEEGVIEEVTGLSILLVEDNDVNRIVASRIIRREWPNANLLIAENGQESIEKLKENEVDVVLMDIQMPVMNGIEATAYIRKHLGPGKKDLPILAMTAHAYVADEGKYKEYLMDDVVLKPFTPKELFHKITKYAKLNKTQDRSMKESNNNQMAEGYQFINLEYLELMADGDNDMKGTLLQMLLSEPAGEFVKMKQHFDDENWEALKQVSHKMKTTLPYIGYEKLTETNVKIDRMLWEQKEQGLSNDQIREQLPAMIEMVTQGYDAAQKELLREYNKTKSEVM